MNSAYYKLCLLISLSNLSQNDLSQIITEITFNKKKFISDIMKARGLSNKNNNYEYAEFNIQSEKNIQKEGRSNSNSISKIMYMLRKEAKLTVPSASLLMFKELSLKYPEIQLLNKQSFRRWLEHLSYFIPESELLHVATKIRNNIVHDSELLVWKFRKSNE